MTNAVAGAFNQISYEVLAVQPLGETTFIFTQTLTP